MLTVQETTYPRLKSNFITKELDKLFSPTLKELHWTRTHSRNPFSHLNYFMPITDVPLVIIKHC